MSANEFYLLDGDLDENEYNQTDNACNKNDDNDDDVDENERRRDLNNRLEKASLTESYSEILHSPPNELEEKEFHSASGCKVNIPKRRPTSLNQQSSSSQSSFPHGSICVDDGNMTHFVAEDLEYKIKIASPNSKEELDDLLPKTATTSKANMLPTESASALLQRQFLSSVPQIDANALNDIEIEAQYLAANIDGITENLCNLLHSISSIAADNVETYKSAVNKLTDCMDANIKTMYTIMAKTEEISNRLKTTENLAARIREIRRLVDMMENAV